MTTGIYDFNYRVLTSREIADEHSYFGTRYLEIILAARGIMLRSYNNFTPNFERVTIIDDF